MQNHSQKHQQQQCCEVVLSLAHLLHQHSPHYDITKNALLSASAHCAMRLANTAGGNDNDGGGEVHLFLTGSPRPTFAETNAWLLRPNAPTPTKNKTNDEDRNDRNNKDNTNEENNEVSYGEEPLVGHAVVNAISKISGIGLNSARSKMLQGTIDRPEWDQTRWTDGECLFSELISMVGLESFEGGISGASSNRPPRRKMATNLSAYLITVPTSSSSMMVDGSGMGEDIVEEIARNILRCLRRRRDSPPASVVHLLLPPGWVDASRLLIEAFHKLEQYNDMIGVPRLMADARVEVVQI